MKPRNNKYTRSPKPRSGDGRRTERNESAAPRPAIRSTDSFFDELKADLATFFEANTEESFSQADVLDHFGIGDRKMTLVVHGLIAELQDEGRLTRQPDGRYKANADANTIEGKVEHANARFAFIVPDDSPKLRARDEDIYVATDDLNGAMDGDRVRVVKFTRARNGARRVEGRVTQILERGRTEVVGTLEAWDTYGFVQPDNRRIYEEIRVPNGKLGGAKTGEKVVVRITRYADGRHRMEGEVLTVLGKAGENNTEMHAILAEFGLPNQFPEAVEHESEEISGEISADEIARRRDFRDITTFTIDPVDAKDFDDALSLRYLDNGNYEVGIHIADVTHYVRPGTALETEAYARATSVYLVDRVVPMLPERLSNGLCSLRPNEDKLTFSAVFELTSDAKLAGQWFGRTIIHSDRRFAYEEAQQVMDTGAGDYVAELTLMNDLAKKLRDERFRRGAINFETPEVRFTLDENGVPTGVKPKIRQDAHKLIEEFMLLANKQVAEFVHGLTWPGMKAKGRQRSAEEGEGSNGNTMVYRVHEGPNPEKLLQFAEFAGRLGYKLKVDEEHLSSSFNRLMESVEGKPEANMLQQLAVRTMSKARYSTEDLGHFGLAFRRYSHFTSPIRRYPDMMAHRLLQHYLDKGKSVEAGPLEAQCKHASERERQATEAERASIKYKQVEFMSRMDPAATFQGVISGVTEFGIFVEIPDFNSEGLVRMQELSDDFYEYDRDNYRIVGKRSKRMFTFGDAVTVRVKETNLAKRSIDFALVDAKGRVMTGERSSSGRGGRSEERGGGRERSSRPAKSDRSRRPKR